jgi:hypothetical protein
LTTDRRFLQHVVRAGFPKVRHYGFESPHSGTLLEAVRWLITVALGAIFTLQTEPDERVATISPLRCPDYGGPLCLPGYLPAPVRAVFDTS